MENENDKIKLSKYVELCIELADSPSEEATQKINDWLAQLQVRPYLSMKDKALTLGEVVFSIPKDFDIIGTSTYLEIYKVTRGLLQYAVNLDNDMKLTENTFGIYDLIMQFGLYDTIISYCEKDYKKFVALIDNTFNFDNIYKLITTIQFFDTESYDKWIENMNQLKTTLTPELIENIKQITKLNNTEISDTINSAIQDITVEKLNKEFKQVEQLKEKQEENTKKDLTE